MGAPNVVAGVDDWTKSSSTYSVVFSGQGLSRKYEIYLLEGREISPARVAEDLEKAAQSVRKSQRLRVKG